uniref:Si:ch211-283h6.4 n=1 Tax=Sinocyclocheilus rhinocerous TaxID=307959 RepID=A0A673LC94_9TELE
LRLHQHPSPSVKYKPGGRLDMSHGFLKHIRRNQMARDDYDREVKQAKEKQERRHTNTPRRPRRPDRQVYHPRHQNGSEPGVNAEAEDWNESSSGTEQENTDTELFWLDYQADNGQITSFIVHKVYKLRIQNIFFAIMFFAVYILQF